MPDQSDAELDRLKQSAANLDFGLLANFVHQVINPLNGVSGTLGNLIDGTVPSAKREQRMRAARMQLEQAISLVRNIAYFSQISIDKSNLNPGKVRKTCVIPQVIIEAIQFYQEMASNKNIAVEHMNKWDQFSVHGNPDLLRQVFMNLIDNAVKYSDSGTKIEITSRLQEKHDTLIVEVVSHGSPISVTDRERIFDLGYRGDNAKHRVASGTGLGLHICRTIIQGVHKGSIYVESSGSGRNSFILKFPDYSEQRAVL